MELQPRSQGLSSSRPQERDPGNEVDGAQGDEEGNRFLEGKQKVSKRYV